MAQTVNLGKVSHCQPSLVCCLSMKRTQLQDYLDSVEWLKSTTEKSNKLYSKCSPKSGKLTKKKWKSNISSSRIPDRMRPRREQRSLVNSKKSVAWRISMKFACHTRLALSLYFLLSPVLITRHRILAKSWLYYKKWTNRQARTLALFTILGSMLHAM